MNSELENAFNKELSLIKNDLYYQQIEVKREEGVGIIRFDIMYKPLDILAGDSYSIRVSKDEKVLFFLLDAMGKGVSASITATTSTTLLNYIFDMLDTHEGFDFYEWVKRYLEYTRAELLDNEMLSILFGCYDRKKSVFEYASFGMPVMLLLDTRNRLHKCKSNNMPVTKYVDECKIDTYNVASIRKALFYTDGLCESLLENKNFYKEELYDDFKYSDNIVDFTQRVREKISLEGDDISFFYIDTFSPMKNANFKAIKANKEALDESLFEISTFIKEYDVNAKCLSELILALSELLANALEHGVFGIDRMTKHHLIATSKIDEEMSHLEKVFADRVIKIQYRVLDKKGKKIFIARIDDGGAGFDTKILRGLVVNAKNFNGRGIMIVKKLVDRFYFNEKGNAITIRKYLN